MRALFPTTAPLLAALVLAGCGPSPGEPDGAPLPDAAGPPADAAIPADAFGGPDLGDPCTTSTECTNGYCVEATGGGVCTYPCTGDCPPNWSCRVTEVDGELVSLCLPVVVSYCEPCTADDQCAGGACIELDGQGYCLGSCFESECPAGYTCGADPTGDHAGDFCIPDTGTCSCTEDSAGDIRTCQVSNPVGTCWGIEICDPDLGWTGCTADTATPEVCNGEDDNCNFLIDDGVAGGDPCTVDVPDVGSCPGTTLCTGATGLICQGPTPTLEVCNYTDDDCDLAVDEGFTDLGDTCQAGVGACLRIGVMKCTSNGTGTECSVTSGPPGTEACNDIDDDCDGPVDENFTDLGDPCAAGTGICERQGSRVCRSDGTGTECSATPGPADPAETCNGLDDTCNGVIDEGFKNPVSGLYDQDTACGSCSVDCTLLFDLPNAQGDCINPSNPQCTMICDPGSFNLNATVADGCEFILDNGAIYVSTSDPAAIDDGTCGLGPVGTGAGHHPCKTIAQGFARAAALSRPRILVANGIYDEAVTLVNGRNLLGGYQWDTWERDVAGTSTQIGGVSVTGTHDRTVIAQSITSPTVFEGFVVRGSINGKVGGNSYAIYVSGSSSALQIINNVIIGGRGGPGADGTAGVDGSGGVNGSGRPSNPAGYDAFTTEGSPCSTANNRQHANGGVLSCGGDVVSGGNGGGNRCPPQSSCGVSCSFSEYSGFDGVAGQPGAGPNGGVAGTPGADAGDDMVLDYSGGTVCYVPSTLTYGLDGLDGGNGAHGAAGPGCSAPAGTVSAGHWVGGNGAAGNAGGNGGGGAGGGGGGGSNCQSAQACNNRDRIGGHGGGGGSGACGGTGGGAAAAGGGAFALFITGGTAPAVTGNSIFGGEGGAGGSGGRGGGGGPGGVGADGGTTTIFCADPAGRGGNGGDGGHGSGGGGGCGGSGFGIYTSGLGTPNYCQAAANNTVMAGGGGSGGPGGYSLINPGGAGSTGSAGSCSFN